MDSKKTCSNCGQQKNDYDFFVDENSYGNRRSVCKTCEDSISNQRDRQRASENIAKRRLEGELLRNKRGRGNVSNIQGIRPPGMSLDWPKSTSEMHYAKNPKEVEPSNLPKLNKTQIKAEEAKRKREARANKALYENKAKKKARAEGPKKGEVVDIQKVDYKRSKKDSEKVPRKEAKSENIKKKFATIQREKPKKVKEDLIINQRFESKVKQPPKKPLSKYFKKDIPIEPKEVTKEVTSKEPKKGSKKISVTIDLKKLVKESVKKTVKKSKKEPVNEPVNIRTDITNANMVQDLAKRLMPVSSVSTALQLYPVSSAIPAIPAIPVIPNIPALPAPPRLLALPMAPREIKRRKFGRRRFAYRRSAQFDENESENMVVEDIREQDRIALEERIRRTLEDYRRRQPLERRYNRLEYNSIAEFGFTLTESSIFDFFLQFQYALNFSSLDDVLLLTQITKTLEYLSFGRSLVVSFFVSVVYEKGSGDKVKEHQIQFESGKFQFSAGQSFERQMFEELAYLKLKIFEDNVHESGLTLLRYENFQIYLNPSEFVPPAGVVEENVGASYVELPKKYKRKHCFVNIKNTDNKCFLWSILASEFPQYIKSKKLFLKKDHFNCTDLVFPVAIDNVHVFEEKNKINVNVYILLITILSSGDEFDNISLIYPSSRRTVNYEKTVNLLLYNNHYVLIKDPNKIFYSLSGHRHILRCSICFTKTFNTKEGLINHELTCKQNMELGYQMPVDPKKKIKFRNINKTLMVPFIIYADSEAFFMKNVDKKTLKVNFTMEHKPSVFAYKVISKYKTFEKDIVYIYGEDCAALFVKSIIKTCLELEKILNKNAKMNLTAMEIYEYERTEFCYICGKKFKEDITAKAKVRDHDHFTGNYRGAAHSICNMKIDRDKFTIPIVFHNLSGYDLHFFINEISKLLINLEIIPKSKEKYQSVMGKIPKSQIKLKFIDSLNFLNGSLSDNALRLKNFSFFSESEKKYTKKQFFPYTYIDSLEKLDEEILPQNLKDWKNELSNIEFTQENLDHVNNIFSELKCKSIKDYLLFYLKIDVLLLAEVFEAFRKTCLKTYYLDPAHYFSLPGFSWDAFLKMTKSKIELLQSRELVDFFISKGSLRGGISTVSNLKYAKANNPLMENYNQAKPLSYIMYYDVTNLYGFIMGNFPLPIKNIKFVLDIEKYQSNIKSLFDEITEFKSFIVEVDIEYPEHLHDQHSELPFLPEHKFDRLIPNLYNKFNYKCHIETLKFCLENGLILKKIHKIISFDQNLFISPYIQLNTNLRNSSTCDLEKNIFKLNNNAVYGKTMENVFKRKNYIFVSSNDRQRRKKLALCQGENSKKFTIITEDLSIIELKKNKLIFDKPMFIGFSILELSKLHMYKLHYSYFKTNFRKEAKLMYMDTDSLVYRFKNLDIYNKMCNKIFDFSVYPESFKRFSVSNKGILGLLKDEFCKYKNNFDTIIEFLCIKSKCYYLKTNLGFQIGKCKGISKQVKINMSDYKECLFNNVNFSCKQKNFKSEKHKIYTIDIEKQAFDNNDIKRINLNNFKTLPYGHFKFNK